MGALEGTRDRGVEAAVARAVAAAGERAVSVIGGADLDRQLLAAGLVDELRVDVVPVLLATACGCSRARAGSRWRSSASTRWGAHQPAVPRTAP